jgi:hypothetical protein
MARCSLVTEECDRALALVQDDANVGIRRITFDDELPIEGRQLEHRCYSEGTLPSPLSSTRTPPLQRSLVRGVAMEP